MILKCDCKSDRQGRTQGIQFQDLRYGGGMRVHTPCTLPGSVAGGRCTICGTTRPLNKRK